MTQRFAVLMANALVPWIIIVPEVNEVEFYKIEASQQQILLQQINQFSEFLKTECKVDKINVASIGNVVQQMHIHVVGRFVDDFCWPGVVWGAEGKKPYVESEVDAMKQKIKNYIEEIEVG